MTAERKNMSEHKENIRHGIHVVAKPRNNIKEKLKHELESLALAMLYFGIWIGLLMVIKKLVLAEYKIEFNGLSLALFGAFVLAKVVLVLEHVPLGTLVRGRPVWVSVLARTVLYAFGVFVVLLLEKAFEGRQEHSGFGPSLFSVFHHTDINRVWANTICLTGALLVYNMLSVVRRHLGKGGLLRLFLSPLPEEKILP
jgi:hypothetical protein